MDSNKVKILGRYYTIKGIDFYNEVFAEIGRNVNIEFRKENINSIEQIGDKCLVTRQS